MKKVVALLLASTLVFSMVACSSGSDTKETTKETAGESQSVEDSSSAENSVSGGDPENAELSFAWWGNQVRTDNTTAACDYYIEQHPSGHVHRVHAVPVVRLLDQAGYRCCRR